MQEFVLAEDIKVLCVKASSFPTGIMPAFQKLHATIPGAESRENFGISYGSKDGIVYNAAVRELQAGEAERYALDSFTIPKGRYIGSIVNWKQDTAQIGQVFQALLKDTRIDPEGACIEQYDKEENVRCMIRLKDEEGN